MSKEIILAVIVSLDTYFVAYAYSISGIKIPVLSAFAISLISSSILGISLKFSELISLFISDDICCIFGFIVLIIIGVITVFKSAVRALIKKLSDKDSFSLKMNNIGIIVKLYLDDTAADFDKSKSLSLYEAAALALAGSVDSAATGLNCSIIGINPIKAFIFSFFSGYLAIIAGSFTGRKISSDSHDFSWIGGVLLIIFAVYGYIS